MNTKKLTLIILLLFTIVNLSQTKSYVEEKLKELSEQNELPGINFSIIDANNTQRDYSFGFADKHLKQNLTPHNFLFSGSIGKTYAFAILMQLVDEGKIVLSRKFIDYFPEVDWLNRVPNINTFTVEMLARHTSGLPRYAMKPIVWKMCIENPDKIWSIKDRMEIVFDDEPAHESGKKWFYSDTGYILLGMLIEKITGKSVYENVKGNITEKFNLEGTIPADRIELPNLAVGYSQLDSSFYLPKEIVRDGKVVFNPQLEYTGGGYINTTHDLARWAKVLYEEKIFSDSLYQKMLTPIDVTKNISEGLSYGMGAFIYETSYGTGYGHTGFMPGYNSIMIYFPEKKMAVSMQFNCDYASKNKSLVSYVEDVLSVIEE